MKMATPRIKITEAEGQLIHDLWQDASLTLYEIADRVGIGRNALCRRARMLGLPSRDAIRRRDGGTKKCVICGKEYERGEDEQAIYYDRRQTCGSECHHKLIGQQLAGRTWGSDRADWTRLLRPWPPDVRYEDVEGLA